MGGAAETQKYIWNISSVYIAVVYGSLTVIHYNTVVDINLFFFLSPDIANGESEIKVGTSCKNNSCKAVSNF